MLQVMSRQGLHLEEGYGAGYWMAALRYHGFMFEGIEYARDLVDLVHVANPELPVRQGIVSHHISLFSVWFYRSSNFC